LDLDSVRLNKVNNSGSGSSLCAVVLKIVIVVEKLSVWIDLRSELEGKWDESLSDGVIEHRLAVATILLKS